MSRTWTDEEICEFRDAMIRATIEVEDKDEDGSIGRNVIEIVTQLVVERQALRDHLSFVLGKFDKSVSSVDGEGVIAMVGYLSATEYRQIRNALPEENR